MMPTWALVIACLVLSPHLLPGTTAFGGAAPLVGRKGVHKVASVRHRAGAGAGAACGGMSVRMSNVKGVASNEDIMNVVQLAKRAMPNRPDGVVVCVQYSSADDVTCMALDAELDRLSETHLDCIFMRCYTQYEGAATTMALRDISSVPTFEVFYRGDSVAKIRGSRINEVEQKLKQYGFVVSNTDLFGQSSYSQSQGAAPNQAGAGAGKAQDPWDAMADQAARSSRSAGGRNNPNAPLRTTMRFYPGGMGGLGQSAADNIREKGSTMDEWQAQRGRRANEAAADDEGALRGTGQPLEAPGEFWKDRLQDQFEIFKEKTKLEDLLKGGAGAPPAASTPAGGGIGTRGGGEGNKGGDNKAKGGGKDGDDDEDIFRAIWND
jgi:hypothetical protein